MKIAQIQMHVSADKAENIRHACELVRSAGDIDLAVLPEMFCCPYDDACFRDYGEPFAGPAQRAMSQLARERGIYLIAGSLPELEGHRVYNTSFVYAPDGTCIARHRKIHLFDIDVEGGQRFMESDVLSPGRASPGPYSGPGPGPSAPDGSCTGRRIPPAVPQGSFPDRFSYALSLFSHSAVSGRTGKIGRASCRERV